MTDSSTSSPEFLKLRAILDSAVDAIITIDDRGFIESVNPATTSLFGYVPDEVVGRNVSMLMPPEYAEEHDGYIEHYLKTGEKKIIGLGREVVGLRKDGTTFPAHLAVSELFLGDRRMFTGIVRDISDLKRAERKLTEMNEQLDQIVQERTRQLRDTQVDLVAQERMATLGQVSGGIAHEIRNPLNAVRTSTYYLLNAENASDEKKREHLSRIDRQVTQIDNVVTALSNVAMLPAPILRPLCAEPAVRLAISETKMPEGITFEFDFPKDLPAILADEHQIPILFRNLIRNALEAMPAGGSITVSAEERGKHVAISIADTGVGIAEADLQRITDPLYSTKVRGMGIGLAICRTIINKNNGSLSVVSEPGKGSTFTVSLTAHVD